MPALLITMSTRPQACSAVLADLLDYSGRGVGAGARSGHRTAGVVDDDARAARRQQQRVLLTQATTGTGDHGDLVVEAHVVCHQVTGSPFMP
jgi:hypothetical protein